MIRIQSYMITVHQHQRRMETKQKKVKLYISSIDNCRTTVIWIILVFSELKNAAKF